MSGGEAARTADVAVTAGVAFPVSADGRRSSMALGRAVVADALRQVDPAGALGAERETNWRAGYLPHFRRLIEAGLASRQAAVTVARDGLESLHRRMRVIGTGGEESGLGGCGSGPAAGAAELGRPGRCCRPAPPRHLGAGAGDHPA